jgi:hypothetical protein
MLKTSMDKEPLIDIFKKNCQKAEHPLDSYELLVITALKGFLGYMNEQPGIEAFIKGRKINLSELTISLKLDGAPEIYSTKIYIPSKAELGLLAELKSNDDLIALLTERRRKKPNALEYKHPESKSVRAYHTMDNFIKHALNRKGAAKGYDLFNENDCYRLGRYMCEHAAEIKVKSAIEIRRARALKP